MEGIDMPRLPCKIEKGKLIIPDFEMDDGDYYFELKPTGVRSSQQNAYYWIIVDVLAEELGYTSQEMHLTIKNHFNIESTKELEKKEFGEFVERLIRWSAIELGVVIPDPR
ncbi:MAG: hypothetical protein HN802_06510 [Candidatus Jacksonbacteria bacterium]|mgnify:CR=1 FL=1|jgi:hypothetical protein|nr:hypothetical protein [Candidatus Jacksonbacteria bacterium]